MKMIKCLYSGNKELRTIRVLSSISHRKKSGSSVLQLEVLIGELLTIDGLTSSSISIREISALDHEAGNDTVENRTLVVKGLSMSTHTLLSSAQSTEVLHSLRDSLSKTTYKMVLLEPTVP